MASYDTEHASDPQSNNTSTNAPRRPDLSTFFSNLSSVRPPSPSPQHTPRPGAVPTPADMSAVYRNLIDAFASMRDDLSGGSPDDAELLSSMIQGLVPGLESPPETPQGVDETYITSLPRIPLKTLLARSRHTPSDPNLDSEPTCPICANPFAADPYSLLVQLPCHPDHVFDLECIRPWLLLKGTCPLDRVDLAERERKRKREREEEFRKMREREREEEGREGELEEEEEWDGMYG